MDPDDLFRPEIERPVRRGEVRLFGNIYFSRELEEWHGQTVRVGYEPMEGARVWVKDLDGRLIAIAEAGANEAPYFPQSRVDQARGQRAKGRLQRLEIKADEVAAELGRKARAEAAAAPLTPDESEAARAKFAELEAPANVIPLTRNGRPLFQANSEKFKWLVNNPGFVTEYDREWIAGYQESDEYRLLFGPGLGRADAAP